MISFVSCFRLTHEKNFTGQLINFNYMTGVNVNVKVQFSLSNINSIFVGPTLMARCHIFLTYHLSNTINDA